MVAAPATPGGPWPKRAAGRLRPAPVAVALLAVLAATGTAAPVSTRLFAGAALTVLLLGAAVGSVALTALLRAARVGPVGSVLTGLVGLAACLVGATAALRDPGSGLAGALLDAVRNSGARILTSAIPVPTRPDTVLLPVAATWLTGSIATVLLGPLRADRPDPPPRAGRAGPAVGAGETGKVGRAFAAGRVGGPRRAAAAVPPVLLLVGGLVLVGPNGTPSYPTLAGFTVSVGVLLAATGRPWLDTAGAGPARVAVLRRAGSAVAVLAVLATVAVLAGPGLAGLVRRQPVDPRSYVTPPRQHVAALNPLGMLAAWALDPHRRLLTVRTNRPARIRWAGMSTFDGIGWQPDRSYRAAGAVLPRPAHRAASTVTVRQTITVDALGGGWLPAVPHVRRVHGVRVAYDAESGSVFTPDGLSTGLTYRTVSAEPEPDPGALAGVGVDTTDERYLDVPAGLPDGIAELARETAVGATPYQRALQLEHLLRGRYRYWAKAPSGNGYVRLKTFLLAPADSGGHAGTSEQFATAFALLARVVGLPSRVVVGFHAGHRISGDRYRVTSGDAFAWPEVRFAGYGWVAFRPTPAAADGRTPPDEDTPQARSRQQQKKKQLDRAAPQPSSSVPAPSASAHPPAAGAGTVVPMPIVAAAAAVLLLLVLVAAVLLLRWRRTARRLDSGPPGGRVLGAWAEVRDTLRLAGVPPDPARSAVEVADVAAAVGRAGATTATDLPPLTDLRPLAGAVNTVAFASADGIGPAEARSAVAAARSYRRDLRTRVGPLRRLAWRLDPRPLFWP